MDRESPASVSGNWIFTGLWIPCGIQNFDRPKTQLRELQLDNERCLMEQFRRGLHDFPGPSERSDVRNVQYVWYRASDARKSGMTGDLSGTEWHYLDSDGFVIAVGPK